MNESVLSLSAFFPGVGGLLCFIVSFDPIIAFSEPKIISGSVFIFFLIVYLC